MAKSDAGYGINWYKVAVGDLGPDAVVTAGSRLFGRVKSIGEFPPYLTARVVRKTFFRRSMHRAKPKFKEPGTVLKLGTQKGFSARTVDAMTVSAARELASVIGYRLYDPQRNASPLLFAGNKAVVKVTNKPTGGVGTLKGSGNVVTGDADLTITRSGSEEIVGEVNVGIDPTLELKVLTLLGRV